MKKALILILALLLNSCSVAVVFSNKEVIIKDGENLVLIKGSELDDVKNDQKSDGNLSIPIP